MLQRCLFKELRLLALIFLLFLSWRSNAQLNPAMGTSPWKWANPAPLGFSFTDMSFIDNNTGLAVGQAGGMARTSDGGQNWSYTPMKFVNSANTMSLPTFNDVQFVTPTVAYAVGSAGMMIKSTDGGFNWTPVVTPLTPGNLNISGLHFLNKDTGYIGGQSITNGNTTSINDAPKIYFTRNGGASWDSLTTPFTPNQTNATLNWNNQKEIQRIHFANDSVGYVVGSAGAGQSGLLWKIEKGVVTDYSIHRTKFGMTTGTHTPSSQTYKGVVAINDSLVLLSSLNNTVTIRVRTGKNDSTANALPAVYGNYTRGKYEIVIWQNSTSSPVPASLIGVIGGQMHHLKKMPDGKIAMSSGNTILFTPDNGTSWTYSKPISTTLSYSHWGFMALDVTPGGRIIAGSFNGLVYDSLPGSPWRSGYKNIRPLFYSFTDMDWADCNNGIIVGANGTFIKTSDGGRTWENNSSTIFDAAQISIGSVVYHNPSNMFFSAGNMIYHSADQGTTNNSIFADPSPNAGSIVKLVMTGPDRAFAITNRFNPAVQRAYIFRSLNASAAAPVWDSVKAFPTGSLAPQLRNIMFANQDTGYVSASRGKVYRTTDGGNTWTDVSPDTTINSNGTNNYTGLAVVNGKVLYVGGSSRKLFRSVDAGVTWTDLTLNPATSPIVITNFTSIGNIVMNDENNGYIQAASALLKTTDGWNTWTADMSPGGMQNIDLYPKTAGPLNNKKLYVMLMTVGFPGPISTQTASMLEYGNAAAYTTSSIETVVHAGCANPNGGSITVQATGGIAPYSYSINGGPFQSGNSFTGLAQGAKTIVIRDAGCQVITKTININFVDNLVLTANNDTLVCTGAPVQLQANAPTGTVFSWSPATGLSGTTIANPVATVTRNTNYVVTATLNGCTKTETVAITVKASPAANAGPDKTIVEGDMVTLEGSGAPTASSVAWTPAATLINANTLRPTASPRITTTYTLSVENNNNCVSTDQATVNVIPYCLKTMDAFTPNGDGVNDRWLATQGGACTNKVTVSVFNRYGSIVYKNDNYQNDWEGTYNGKPVADGTYYYTVVYTLLNGKQITNKGSLTILR